MVERRRRGGRKPISDTAATVAIYVRVTEQAAAELNDIARENLTTRAAFIRDAVTAAIAECSERRGPFVRSA